MAKNYSLAEATMIIAENKDKAAIADLGKRYPVLTVMLARVATKAGSDFTDFMSFIPEHISANKINKAIKETIGEVSDSDDDFMNEPSEEKPKKEKKSKKDRKSKKSKAKVEKEAEEELEEEEVEDGKYEGMDAQDLFKECKKRGLKAKPKRSAKFYIAILEEDDAKNADSDEDEDDVEDIPDEVEDDDDEWDI